ncbi:MAG: VOC family protein [Candidatus Krumholzibacteria bacterium]|nr:VOC family protein [Candidatus Krumholzibacteria bacterium]
MTQLFHLSLVVPDLNRVRAFYVDVLGCRVGREMGSWLDILFFGHQLTIHQANERKPAVAVDHFGPVLEKAAWLRIAENCRKNSIEFITPPQTNGEGAKSESGKFVISDPAGNRLEFKYYEDIGGTIGNRS